MSSSTNTNNTYVNIDKAQLEDFRIQRANFEYNLLIYASEYKSIEAISNDM